MRRILKELMNLDEPVLTEKLAPKIAPYAKILYLIVLIILGLSTLGSLSLLVINPLAFIGALFLIMVEFALVRMFCEYLISTHPDRK